MNVLDLAREVADDLNYQVPSTLFSGIGGTDDERKLRRAVKKTARFLHQYHDWPDLRQTLTFTAGANGLQASALPADFGRIIKGSFWNVTKREPVPGPVLLHEYTRRGDESRVAIMIKQGGLYYTSPHAAGDSIRGHYITRNYVTPATGSAKSEITADTDTLPWDDELMHLGIVWALLQRDGDTTSDDYTAFISRLHETINDGADGTVLDMGGGDIDLSGAGWPATGWELA